MIASAAGGPPRQAAHAALALAAALPAMAALVAWTVWVMAAPPPMGTFSDSIDYLVLSEYYSRYFRDHVPAYAVAFFGQSRFPPLYPLLLATVDASPTQVAPAMWLDLAIALLATLATTAWYLATMRPAWAAALLALVGSAAAAPLLLVMNPVSEPFLQLLLMVAFLFAGHARPRPSTLLVLAALVGVVPLARMVGVALVAAFAAWLWRRTDLGWPRRLACAAIAALPALAWLGYRSLLPIEESYVGSMTLERLLAGFGGWSGLLRQPLTLLQGLAGVFDPMLGAWAWSAAIMVVVLTAVAIPERLRANALDAWYALAYFGLILVWPYPAEATRLMLALLPVLLLQAWHGAVRLVCVAPTRWAWPRATPALFAVLTVLACVPGWWQLVHRARLPLDADLEPYRRAPAFFKAESDKLAMVGTEVWARIVAMAEELPQVVSRQDCIYTFFPAMVWLQSGQRVRVKPIPFNAADDPELPQRMRDCRYILPVNTRSAQTGAPALFPLEALRAQTRPVLSSEFSFRGGQVVAAVLLEWRDYDPMEREDGDASAQP